MLADYGISMPSTFCLENILLKDVSPESWKYSPEGQSNDSDLLIQDDAQIDNVQQYHNYCGLGNLSTGTSVASSDCSDDLYHDLDGDLEIDLFGDLASSVLNLIQDIEDSDEAKQKAAPVSCVHCSKSDDSNDLISENMLKYNGVEKYTKCLNCSSKQRQHRKRGKKWSELNEEEKLIIVDQMSQNISQNLGLREQLEVIRIIDPRSSVSPTDKQFLIDISNMTEEKIQKIEDYIKTHTCTECLPDNSISHSSPRKSKKKQVQERKNRHRMDKSRQRKEYRQILKEKRSGLFVKEEVLSMSRLSPPPENEDIDILE